MPCMLSAMQSRLSYRAEISASSRPWREVSTGSSGRPHVRDFQTETSATSLYTLTLGVLGFIPAPSGVPVRIKKDK